MCSKLYFEYLQAGVAFMSQHNLTENESIFIME